VFSAQARRLQAWLASVVAELRQWQWQKASPVPWTY